MPAPSTAPLLRAYRGDRPEVTPVWFAPSPGVVPRDGVALLDACLSPALVAELTVEPVRRHGTDAAVLFTDPVVPLLLAGVDLTVAPGAGPVVARPVRTALDVLALRPIDPAVLAPVAEAVGLAVQELGGVPLIAIAGAPYTLASLLVEGGPTADQRRARTLMYDDPHTWATLLNWCADVSGAFLRVQVEAGAAAARLVDPSVGSLSEQQYVRRVAPHSQRAFSHLRGLDVPKVHSALGGGGFLRAMHAIGAEVLGVDWRVPLDDAEQRLGGGVPLQGNLDPAILAAPWAVLRAHLDDVLDRGLAAPAHVLTLGGDLPPDTDPDVLTRIVEYVHARG